MTAENSKGSLDDDNPLLRQQTLPRPKYPYLRWNSVNFSTPLWLLTYWSENFRPRRARAGSLRPRLPRSRARPAHPTARRDCPNSRTATSPALSRAQAAATSQPSSPWAQRRGIFLARRLAAPAAYAVSPTMRAASASGVSASPSPRLPVAYAVFTSGRRSHGRIFQSGCRQPTERDTDQPRTIVLIEPAALDPAEEGSVVTLVTGEKITLALSEENIFRGLKYSISSGPRATATSAT
jgi:hypothetical protein